MTQPHVLEHDWFPAPLPDNVELGPGSWVYSSYAFLHCKSRRPRACTIGRDVGVYIGTMFDLGVDAEVRIGDCSLLAGVKICTEGRVSIGRYSLMSYQVTIADAFDAVPPFAADPECRPPAHRRRGTTIEIGDDTWIGVGATILGGAKLGDGAIVGAACVVDFEVPPYAVVAGNPGRVVGEAPPRRAGDRAEP